jgi:hypothetical protein
MAIGIRGLQLLEVRVQIQPRSKHDQREVGILCLSLLQGDYFWLMLLYHSGKLM